MEASGQSKRKGWRVASITQATGANAYVVTLECPEAEPQVNIAMANGIFTAACLAIDQIIVKGARLVDYGALCGSDSVVHAIVKISYDSQEWLGASTGPVLEVALADAYLRALISATGWSGPPEKQEKPEQS